MRRRALTKEEMLTLKSSAATLMQSLFRGMRGKRGAAVLRKDRDAEDARKQQEEARLARERQAQADQLRAAQRVYRTLRRAHCSVQARALRSWHTWSVWDKKQKEGLGMQRRIEELTGQLQASEIETKKAWKIAGETAAELETTKAQRDALQKRARDAELKCKSMQKLIAQYADRQRELDDEIRGLESKVVEAAKGERTPRSSSGVSPSFVMVIYPAADLAVALGAGIDGWMICKSPVIWSWATAGAASSSRASIARFIFVS